ncbi:MAG: hypothetical protein ACRDZV_15490 [Acidimicrobiia bacterium]
MPRGKPSPKLAITVDPEVHAGVVAAASEEGVSVSMWMTNAARRALLARDGLKAVADWEAEHGALSNEELADARRRVAEEMRGLGRKPA